MVVKKPSLPSAGPRRSIVSQVVSLSIRSGVASLHFCGDTKLVTERLADCGGSKREIACSQLSSMIMNPRQCVARKNTLDLSTDGMAEALSEQDLRCVKTNMEMLISSDMQTIRHEWIFLSQALSNKRLERTRHERASLLSCVGEPLKRSVACSCFMLVVSLERSCRKKPRWSSLSFAFS